MTPNHYSAIAEPGRAWGSSDATLNIVIVYENAVTQAWAWQTCGLVAQFIDRASMATNSWRVCELAFPQVLYKAVCAAARADVIILSLRDAEELPLNLQGWIGAWLPRRDLPVGTVIALIELDGERQASSAHIRGELEAIASQARMDLVLEERRLQTLASCVTCHGRGCGSASILADQDNSGRLEVQA